MLFSIPNVTIAGVVPPQRSQNPSGPGIDGQSQGIRQSNVGAIVGGVVGGIGGVALLLLIGFILWRRSSRAKDRGAIVYYSPSIMDDAMPCHIAPEESKPTVQIPVGGPGYLPTTKEQEAGRSDADQYPTPSDNSFFDTSNWTMPLGDSKGGKHTHKGHVSQSEVLELRQEVENLRSMLRSVQIDNTRVVSGDGSQLTPAMYHTHDM